MPKMFATKKDSRRKKFCVGEGIDPLGCLPSEWAIDLSKYDKPRIQKS